MAVIENETREYMWRVFQGPTGEPPTKSGFARAVRDGGDHRNRPTPLSMQKKKKRRKEIKKNEAWNFMAQADLVLSGISKAYRCYPESARTHTITNRGALCLSLMHAHCSSPPPLSFLALPSLLPNKTKPTILVTLKNI